MNRLSQLTDEELALKYVEGNNRAFDELLGRVQTSLFSYIIFIVHNQETANDIFQDTFLKAITKLKEGKYRPTGKFNAWMIRIAHNAIMDWYRRKRTANIVDAPDDDLFIAAMSDDQLMDSSKEDMLANAQVLCDVKNLIDYLPEPQRDIIYMRYYQNMAFKDIAEQTKTSINTCLGRARYGLINMRRLAKQKQIQLQLA